MIAYRLIEYCRKLYEAARQEPHGSFYVLTSFDERPLKVVKALDANADLLLISGDPCSEKVVARARALGVQRIGCAMDGTSRAAVREAQKAGLRVTGWPGRSLQDYYLAVGLGVDAFCTDIPIAISTWKARLEQSAPSPLPMKTNETRRRFRSAAPNADVDAIEGGNELVGRRPWPAVVSFSWKRPVNRN